MAITFFFEDTSFSLKNQPKLSKWVASVIATHKYSLVEINYIFCSDEYLLQINKDYLAHDYYTDIITFDHSETPIDIVSDIYISADRVKENADLLKVSFYQELNRVMIHGVLHLLGFKDKTDEEQIRMREKEDACLSLLEN